MNSKIFLKKLFLPFKEVLIYIIILTLFFVYLSSLVYTGGFISFPFIIFYTAPIAAIFAWPITIILNWFIGSILARVQRKILSNNKKVFISFIVIILLLILIYPFTLRHSLMVFKIFPSSSVCQVATDNNGDRDYCYFKLAIKNNDAKLCSKAGLSDTDCYLQLAIKNNSLSICDMLVYPGNYYYQTTCYTKLAIINNDLKICDSVSTDSMYNKSDCYTAFALVKKDVSICSLPYPEDDYIINRCKATVLGTK